MDKEELRRLMQHEDDKTIAYALMNIAHADFNEGNFYYYDYSISIFCMVVKLESDGIISKDKSEKINREIAKLINEAIYVSK